MISFTGSTRAGRRVAELAAGSVKKVALELGGKSPFVLLDDADFSTAVRVPASTRPTRTRGRHATRSTRMLVPRSRLAEVEQLAREAAESYVVGDPFDDATQLGPLVSAVQRDRVRDYIEQGVAEGATLVTGGADAPDGSRAGYFVKPTVFSNVTRDMTIAREEIFGPGPLDHPVRHRGRSGRDRQRHGVRALRRGVRRRRAPRRVARKIRAGQVRVNDGARLPRRAVRRLQAVGPRPRERYGTGSRSSSRSRRSSSELWEPSPRARRTGRLPNQDRDPRDIELFTEITGDRNPLHYDEGLAAGAGSVESSCKEASRRDC